MSLLLMWGHHTSWQKSISFSPLKLEDWHDTYQSVNWRWNMKKKLEMIHKPLITPRRYASLKQLLLLRRHRMAGPSHLCSVLSVGLQIRMQHLGRKNLDLSRSEDLRSLKTCFSTQGRYSPTLLVVSSYISPHPVKNPPGLLGSNRVGFQIQGF